MVYKRGAKKVSRSFVVFVLGNGLGYTRVGFTATRKLGIAVERNRIRRRMREIFRLAWASIPSGIDIVVNPRRPACTQKFADLRVELLSLVFEARA